ncbi:MAG: hypothetical protein CMK44_01305 [Porticoccus sp.]|nr:hypothetical protein [Porticoccus sp.]|tara:strand:- start:85 stop:738 length:654 start_codon:yes stop_codon:yes gene_type:complete
MDMDRGDNILIPSIMRANRGIFGLINSIVTPIVPLNNTNNNASEEFINSLEEITVDEEILKKNLQCSICLDEFKVGDKCIILPCSDNDNDNDDNENHIFHSGCDTCSGIKEWLKRKNTCPMCRKEFPTENRVISSDTDTATNMFQTITIHTPMLSVNNSTGSNDISNPNIENMIPDPNNLENTISNLITNYINEIEQNNEQRDIQLAIEASLNDSLS